MESPSAHDHYHQHAADEIIYSPSPGWSTSEPELQTQAIIPLRTITPEPRPRRLDFFSLPYELRLDIYELLLLTPEPIIVSSSRRQLHVKVEPPEHQVAYLRAPRPRPRVVSLTHRKPHVEILQTCRQIEQEATPILYGRNSFVVGFRLCVRQSHQVEEPFIRRLRLSILLQLRSVTFRPGCYCDQWLKSSGSGQNVAGMLGRKQLNERGDHQWDIEAAFWQTYITKSRVCAFCHHTTRERILIGI
ncbi:hypothetical protein BDP81DRAFT_89845 [Colletotrichum phormii]|uniref:DUF7730 domain-containing protein n=1 Tax=Colletotrichum phormii TaxID=359342 RepID=A0AAJ0A1R3_9PEZI|nr:uncharacterized protein BDP81DRAFT_89845 [Colletotrichum phormii]KAK1654860.1 hypothetical protein BDP81DRAFT_89845 [Colletotrichum phormii]